MNGPNYQVALSFAGEQREYVEEVARHLRSRSIAVFYDGFETVSFWGRSGVGFWNSANTSYRYRFDGTEVPGLPGDIIYLCARERTPAQLSAEIADKLGTRPFAGKASEVPPPRMTSLVGEVVFDYSSYNGRYVIGSGVLEFETKWSSASDTYIHVYSHAPSINGVALARGRESISTVESAASLDYTSNTQTPSLREIVVLRNTEGFYAAVQLLGIKNAKRNDDQDELRFRYAIQSNGSDDFRGFVDL